MSRRNRHATARTFALALAITSASAMVSASHAQDWTAFRGADGSARHPETKAPLTWADDKNVRWKAALPGGGSSSPIVSNGRVFLTCFGGYGTDLKKADQTQSLERHLVCFDLETGKQTWSASIPASKHETKLTGQIMQHGYASHTPAADEHHVFAFFGPAGVFAFDAKTGKQRWHTSVGTMSSPDHCGSAASVRLVGDLVLINAANESRSIVALDRKTGAVRWRFKADELKNCYGTPTPVVDDGAVVDIVISASGTVFGLDPERGTLNWRVSTGQTGTVAPSISADGVDCYVFGGMGKKGACAIRAGDAPTDANATRVRWTSKLNSFVPTPLYHDGHLYWTNAGGIARCVDATSGKLVYQARLGGRCYASPVLCGRHILYVSQTKGTFVVPAEPAFKVAHVNKLGDQGPFHATPAVAGDRILLRSPRFLYCIGATPKRD